jgi:hypothetical protein
MENGIVEWKPRRRGQCKYILCCRYSSLLFHGEAQFTWTYLASMSQKVPAYIWKELLIRIIWTLVVLTTLAIYGDGKVGGTPFAPNSKTKT